MTEAILMLLISNLCTGDFETRRACQAELVNCAVLSNSSFRTRSNFMDVCAEKAQIRTYGAQNE